MELFLTGFLLSLSVCLDLGTVNVAMLRTGLQHGTRPAFMLGLGSTVGDMVYAVLSVMAISLVLDNRAVRWALWIGGTALLMVLAYRGLQDALKPVVLDERRGGASAGNSSAGRNIAYGAALALSSPSAILWFASVGGSLIASSASTRGAVVPFFAGFASCGVVWSLAVALISGQGRKVMGPVLVRGLSVASALIFLGLAVKVFVDGYNALIR